MIDGTPYRNVTLIPYPPFHQDSGRTVMSRDDLSIFDLSIWYVYGAEVNFASIFLTNFSTREHISIWALGT
jgi:hypothetical protein